MRILRRSILPAIMLASLILVGAQGQISLPFALLSDSIVKNQGPPLWERYRLEILAVSMGFVVLILLVAFLVGLTRRLNTARLALSRLNSTLETQVQERTAILSQTNRRLEAEIAERKRAEEVLRQSEAQYRLLAENMVDVIWTLNPAGRFTYVSPSVQRLRGYTPQEVLSQSPAEVLTPASLQTMQAALMATIPHIEKGAQHYEAKPTAYELEQLRKDGSTIWTEALERVLFDDDGNFSGFLGVSRDIAERKRAEAERERLIAELQEALAKVKQLEGILPVCSFCKKIRDEDGTWQPMEAYIGNRSRVEFSHSFCPDCSREHYPEYFAKPTEE